MRAGNAVSSHIRDQWNELSRAGVRREPLVAPEHVGARVDRVIARGRSVDGDSALFAHGHVLRVFAARWIRLPPDGGRHFLLSTGTLCVLSYYREIPAVRIWNGPLLD